MLASRRLHAYANHTAAALVASASASASATTNADGRHARARERPAGRMAAAAGDMVWVRVLEEGVIRFDASEAARAAAGPSLSFADPRRREVPREGSDAPAVLPTCEVVGGVQKVVVKVRGMCMTLR